MKKFYKRIISILVLIVLTTLAYLYLKNNIETFRSLKIVSPILLLLLIALFLSTYILIAYLTRMILKTMKISISNRESFMLSIVTGFYNLITPLRGGLAARALYLKKNHQFSYTDFISSVAASYVIIFLVASVTGLSTALLIFIKKQIINWILVTIFFIVFLAMMSIILFSKKLKESKYFLINKIIMISNSWNIIRKKPRIIIAVSLIAITQLLISALMLKLQFSVFGFHISFVEALFISSIGSLSLLISITPAGLGINEAITVFSALTLGISPAQSLSAALLGRAAQIIILFILGPIFSFILFRIKSPMK
ncbi:flippase-like domain-containing protein [Candidatus Pacearchaeota archaeon]|nr:flippase-like domain-containing protein [Candidatus Pacearchaeota archaeon]